MIRGSNEAACVDFAEDIVAPACARLERVHGRPDLLVGEAVELDRLGGTGGLARAAALAHTLVHLGHHLEHVALAILERLALDRAVGAHALAMEAAGAQ